MFVLAAGGEIVLVTDRDRVVAEIGTASAGSQPPTYGCPAGRSGPRGLAYVPPVLAGDGPPPRKSVMTLRDLMQDLKQDRIITGDLPR